MQHQTSFWSRCRAKAILVGIVFALLLAPPQPAKAVVVFDPTQTVATIAQWVAKAAEYATNLAELEAIWSAIETVSDTFGGWMDTLTDLVNDLADIKIANIKAETELDTRLAEAEIEDYTANKIAEATAKIAQRAMPSAHHGLCRQIRVESMGDASISFTQSVETKMIEALSARDRCPTCDGAGPAYSWTQAATREKGSYLHPLEGGADSPMADADITMPRNEKLCIPLMQRGTWVNEVSGVSLEVIGPKTPAPSNLCERRYLAAWDWLTNLAGSRPTPLSGQLLQTDEGNRQRGMYVHCLAMENTLLQQCSRVIAFQTRPNKADPSTEGLIKLQQNFCKLMDGTLSLEPYDNCENGLSLHEINRIAGESCKSMAYAVGQKHDGARNHDVMESSDMCSLAWRVAQMYEDDIYATCMTAMDALDGIKSCWAAVEGGQRGFRAEGQQDEKWTLVSMRDEYAMHSSKFYKPPVAKLQPVAGYRMQPVPSGLGAMPVGVPANADDFAWPQTSTP
ncbi:MAG: hypothetical protein FWF24_00630 [Alphaproteobacteria bacterium]|nr:hypothetical protein [Alphaproteobacteria bacterium]